MRSSKVILAAAGGLVAAIVMAGVIALGSTQSNGAPPAAAAALHQTDTDSDDDAALETRTGTIQRIEDAEGEDGNVAYELTSDAGTIRLDVGPPWFWGDDNPLEPYVGTEVDVAGRVDDGTPSEHANQRARENAERRGAQEPSFEVFSVDGNVIREPGKPPWAGGPKVVGDRHPGFGHGQGNGSDEDADSDD